MSRIIAGIAGGHSLHSVPGSATRPTTDRVKEALFSRLEAMDVIKRSRVLDLYAGSGALGIESASRGASFVALVESDARAAAVAKQNAQLVNRLSSKSASKLHREANREAGAEASVSVHRAKVESFLQKVVDPWDLVFLDPPYPLTEPELAAVLKQLAPQLAEAAVVVVERSSRSPEPSWPEGLIRFSERSYGETVLWFAEPAERGEEAPTATE
ncbi:16S rRNA (guanine(966)-N(2))-methyltransferase RsmD [Psychromicrobium lacuslunae]|uniref:Methyltransferase n=1 Tax=Psychromicrobium lacuslunae TaxID=1618207 RepID=A0A0D4BYN3_9MICC|nr:16S rRNA (guanine(966)-N(2))-methyltransferase RsmD [Psychromicrobium lacuslunae]AJT41240.1 methyltransferase [Psychromicrobium lacuslunae]